MRLTILFLILLLFDSASAQSFRRDFDAGEHPRISIENRYGQIRVAVGENADIKLFADAPNNSVEEAEIAVSSNKNSLNIAVSPTKKRIDLTLLVPSGSRLNVSGANGEVQIVGDFESADVSTDTGTIYADVPTDRLKFYLLWTESRPRYLSDFEIPQPKEKAGGKFAISGKILKEAEKEKSSEEKEKPDETDQKTKKQKTKDKFISLNLTTKRGVILLNVPPSQVPADLRERPLTNAAKAIVKGGDSILSEAVRRASPKYFKDYVQSLGERRRTPTLKRGDNTNAAADLEVLRRVNVTVADRFGRAVNNLTAEDFTLLEAGQWRKIVSVAPTNAPFNLVLLLDVSGSVEEKIDFIRKAARNFVNTIGSQDKLAIVTFRDDVQVLSGFTQDKKLLSQSLDTFDAGGGTALYDSIAFTLTDILQPLKAERTAIVILSDGDDNRSFVPFEPLLGAIEETGTLVYPLYVPSELIPSNAQNAPSITADPIRTRYLSVTSKAEAEAKKLAEVSGGVYFPIRQLEDLQKAYDDVVAQLRTAYSLTYRSKTNNPRRVRVSVKQNGAFVRAGTPVEVNEKTSTNTLKNQ
jgi:VWFA-related protein